MSSVPTTDVRQKLIVTDNGPFSLLMDTAKFEHLWRIAQTFAASDLVPKAFQGKPANCLIILQMAMRLDVDPFMLFQGCYVVSGRPGMEAKVAIALANRSGKFKSGIQYRLEGEGKTRQCTAFAVLADCGELIEQTVSMAMADAEGWSKKDGSKWKTLPDLMLQYRAAMFLIRLHCPEAIMGMYTREEIEDIGDDSATRIVRSLERPTLTSLTERLQNGDTTPESKPEWNIDQYRADLSAATTAEEANDVYSTALADGLDEDQQRLAGRELQTRLSDIARAASTKPVQGQLV